MKSSEILINSPFEVQMILRKRKAFDVKTAAILKLGNLNLVAALDVMEKGGLIERTSEGKIFITTKGLEQSTRGFKVSNSYPDRKFVRFSRSFSKNK